MQHGIASKVSHVVLLATILVGFSFLFWQQSEPAAQVVDASISDAIEAAQYAPRGADACLTCHNTTAVNAIQTTSHWRSTDFRTPAAQHDCESCHGASPEHLQSMRSPAVVFSGNGRFPQSDVSIQNQSCLGCHQTDARTHWAASSHQAADVTCVSCHDIHASSDQVLSPLLQAQTCFGCHQDKRAELNRRSHHPVAEGLMSCSSCHNPHGSVTASLLAKNSINETCTGCHTEKRGPFLWEHQPVAEACTNCHNPHGSTQAALLNIRQPFLCQTCHQDVLHPSSLYSGTGIPDAGAAQTLLGSACTNCHSQVHGSNHPSGSRFTR